MAAKKSAKKSNKKNVKKSPSKSKASKPKKQTPLKANASKSAAAPKKAVKSAKPVSLTPSGDGVLLERVTEPDRTPGGLFIPASAQEKPLKGIVIQAGRGKFSKRGKLRPLDVQAGDEVLFSKYAGTEIKVDGKDYLLVREDEILGVVS